MTQEKFDKLVEQSQPHKIFNTEWNKYFSLQFADTFLPKVKGYQGKGMRIYDGANLFEKTRKTERKLQSLTNDDKLISITGYTFPEGVLASEKKNLVRPVGNEVCFFAEVSQKDTVNLTFTYGKNFKEFLKELTPKRDNIKTTVQKVKEHFNNTITHENVTEFVLKNLGVEKEAIKKANYNQFFNKKVLNYLEETKVNGKYKVQLFIKKTQEEAGLESGDLDFKKVKVLEPLPNEVFIWLVSEDNINFDTSFILIKVGIGIAKDLKEKQTTVKELVVYLSNLIKEELGRQTFSNSKIEKEIEKGLLIPFFKLHTVEKTKNNPIAKEIAETNPVAFLAVEGIDYLTQGIEKFKVTDNVWNPQLQPYTPIFPDKLENAFFCGLFNGAVQAFKELPEMATFIIKVFNSETESKQFVAGIKKLFTDVEVIKAIANKAIEGYKEGVYTKNTEKVVYHLGYDTIKIISFFIGVVQFTQTVGNLIKFTKNGLLYLKKYGKKGINRIGKLDKKEIVKLYQEFSSVDNNNTALKRIFKTVEELKDSLKKNNIANKYSNQSLDKLLAQALRLEMSDEDLLGFIKVGNIKDISFSELLKQMENYVTIILKRGYPFKFDSLEQFKRFSRDLLEELKKVNIPIDDVRIQGSSLRKGPPKTPKDIDLAVFVSDDIFNDYLKKAFENKIKLDGKKIDISKMSNEELIKLAKSIFEGDSNATSRTFGFAILNGKISASTKPRIIFGHKDVVRTLNDNYGKLNIEDISIQKIGGKLELKPEFKIK